ncbi:hypothetical protein [Kitasatospora sp. LaBMicrA B282]|uniref:hypothetical protein n=1 Tax=Kitasatospora sp. LaBMicrA B282 TaxID=3420949 RepID=UPI003D12BF6F
MPNQLLQNRLLSYSARGLLVDLLSRPAGWREDGRRMADSSPQGRTAVARALNELKRHGYYWVLKVRQADGTLRSEVHVFDTPQQVAPDPVMLGPGVPRPGSPVAQKRETRETAPTPRPTRPVDPVLREAVAALYRVIRPERRLRLGEAEAWKLAPLVADWLRRGSSLAELGQALLTGLPAVLDSPMGLIRSRLQRKMPPEQVDGPTERAALHECVECRDPLPRPGRCGACAGRGAPLLPLGGGHEATARGAASARAAMRATVATIATSFES